MKRWTTETVYEAAKSHIRQELLFRDLDRKKAERHRKAADTLLAVCALLHLPYHYNPDVGKGWLGFTREPKEGAS